MAGELWRGTVQMGKEVTPGTPVAATRKMYMAEPTLTIDRDPRPHRFATQTRDNVRGFTLGPQQVGGEMSMPLSSAEIIEFLLIGLKGGVTPTTPGGATTSRLWTFTPDPTLDAATIEWHDGARAWQAAGCRVDEINISGAVGEENTIKYTLFGQSMVANALTGALADRTPEFYEGWETKMYIDAFGATPGTTAVDGMLLSWDITISNQLARKYAAANTLSASGISFGELDVEANLVFEAAPAAALTEFNNWAAATKRLIRLEFGNNQILEAALKSFVTVDLPGAWSANDLSGDDEGTRTYEMTLQYVYDPALAAGVKIQAQNSRSSAF